MCLVFVVFGSMCVDECVRKNSEGVVLFLHVTPNADQVVFPVGVNKWRHCVEIRVQGEAQQNKANDDVIKAVAAFFGVSTKEVMLISGVKSRDKAVLIRGVLLEVVRKRLCEVL